MLWTRNTEIKSTSGFEYSENGKYVFGATENSNIIFTITNCAVDKYGNMCDVEIIVDNPKTFETQQPNNGFGNGIRTRLVVNKEYGFVKFQFLADAMTSKFTMTYYKAGTKVPDTDIKNVVSTVYEIDVNVGSNTTQAQNCKNEAFQGNEGIYIPNGVIYFDKTSSGKLEEDTTYAYKNGGMGIGVKTKSGTSYMESNTNGLQIATSAVIMQPITNAKYELTYSGINCGIAFLFASPYQYELEKPSKTVSKNRVYEEEVYHYTINQYVPNNYILRIANDAARKL